VVICETSLFVHQLFIVAQIFFEIARNPKMRIILAARKGCSPDNQGLSMRSTHAFSPPVPRFELLTPWCSDIWSGTYPDAILSYPPTVLPSLFKNRWWDDRK
jgi:hypothetical protein